MRSIFDPRFKYTPSFDTDVKKTIERVKREQKQQREQNEANKREAEVKVKTIAARRA